MSRHRQVPFTGEAALSGIGAADADVEGELNGLLTCERIPKVLPEKMRAINGRGAA